jgi:hypothetical protein
MIDLEQGVKLHNLLLAGDIGQHMGRLNGLASYSDDILGWQGLGWAGGSQFEFGMISNLRVEPESAPCGWRSPHRHLNFDESCFKATVTAAGRSQWGDCSWPRSCSDCRCLGVSHFKPATFTW